MSESIFPKWCAPAARVASVAYGAIVSARNARRDRGVGVRSIPRPVVSIGNIVAGGTGKSPMTRWVAQWAISRRIVPLIALRGYRSHDGRSDEAIEHQALIPEARLAVGANRFETITACLAREQSIGMVILDDGFQHRALARDLDLVLVDSTRHQLDGRLLPLGWLREPASSLARASAVVVTRAATVDATLDARIRSMHGRGALAWCDHVWESLDLCCNGVMSSESVEWFQGRKIAVWAGIGRPDAFVDRLTNARADIVTVASLRDHARYGRTTISRLGEQARRAGATAIVATGKDWVKIALDADVIDLPIAIPRVQLRFSAGEDALRDRLESAVLRR